jgi:hypothetical protein
MSLSPGAHLGPYEILAFIGAGGMGEVTARDTRLDRQVAVKTLPRQVAADRSAVRASSVRRGFSLRSTTRTSLRSTRSNESTMCRS